MLDFKTKSNNEAWYDLIEDWDLIESSFAKQYGIRLRSEPDMTWGEFCNLLSGIMPETPLGNIVSIRSEKDPKVLKSFTKQQKKIRSDWKSRNANNVDKESYDQAMKNFENMFRAIASKK